MPPGSCTWRVAVTRDEDRDGPLASALAAHGLSPVPCPVLVEAPAGDLAALAAAARDLERYDWVVLASARAVRAVAAARGRPWPVGIRTAAVGESTARAIGHAGVELPPLVGASDGAEALWQALAPAAWSDVRVLVPTTPGGRTDLADRLRDAGADVTVVEAYRMEPRPPAAIAADWAREAPDAVVIASPRTGHGLVRAIGADALRAMPVVAIGASTAAALAGLGVPSEQPDRAGFDGVARLLAARASAGRSA